MARHNYTATAQSTMQHVVRLSADKHSCIAET